MTATQALRHSATQALSCSYPGCYRPEGPSGFCNKHAHYDVCPGAGVVRECLGVKEYRSRCCNGCRRRAERAARVTCQFPGCAALVGAHSKTFLCENHWKYKPCPNGCGNWCARISHACQSCRDYSDRRSRTELRRKARLLQPVPASSPLHPGGIGVPPVNHKSGGIGVPPVASALSAPHSALGTQDSAHRHINTGYLMRPKARFVIPPNAGIHDPDNPKRIVRRKLNSGELNIQQVRVAAEKADRFQGVWSNVDASNPNPGAAVDRRSDNKLEPRYDES